MDGTDVSELTASAAASRRAAVLARSRNRQALSVLDRGCGRYTDDAFEFRIATVGAFRLVPLGADEHFDHVVARFALEFVKRHDSPSRIRFAVNIMVALGGFRKMNLPALSRHQVRQVDQIAIESYGIPGVVLMENAGRGAAEIIDQLAGAGPITILCGSGNNAGDGYVIARHLQLAGRQVAIVSIVELEKLRGDAQINAEIARHADIDIIRASDRQQLDKALSDAGTIVDGLLGTGAQGPLRGLFADAVAAANDRDALRVALDIPTGLDCDSGAAADPTFRADHTITFVAAKQGFARGDAAQYVGEVHVVGIGAPQKLLDEFASAL